MKEGQSCSTAGDLQMDVWLERLRKEIVETTKNLSDSEWNRAPAGQWNCAQIVEHLARTYGTTAKMLELSIGSGCPPQVRSATIAESIAKILVVNLGIFPSGAKSPALVMPKGDAGPVALDRALTNLTRMDTALLAAEERWGSDEPIAMHMTLGPLNTGQWRKFHYLHAHHHVRQMLKRLNEPQAKTN